MTGSDASGGKAIAASARPALARYAVPVGAVMLAFALRWSVHDTLGERMPFLLFAAAIAVSAWYGEWRAGLLAALLSVVAIKGFLIQPAGLLSWTRGSAMVVIGSFGVGAIITVALQAMHRANHRLRAQIAEVKHGEQALRQSEERFRTIAEALRVKDEELEAVINRTPFMLTRCGKDLRYRFVSHAYASMIGRKPADFVGKPIIEIMGEHGFKTIQPHVEKVLAGNHVEYESDVPFQGVGTRSLRVVYTPDRDKEGNVDGWIASILDVTERKRAEEALDAAQQSLREHAAKLETVVEERTVRLREVVAELQQLSYAMAHDMRAPLRAMAAFAEMLLEESFSGGKDAQAQDYCRRIVTAAQRLDKLIQDALSYSKTVLQEFPSEPVNVGKLLRGIIDSYPNLHADKAEVRVEGDLPVVLGNGSLLTQCFSNLLDNAVKFVAPKTRPVVRIRAETSGSTARFWVEDNGIGIPEQARSRLFGMFQKLNTQYDGTGVGLAIVRKVVERMGGRVGVESELGVGSRFWVELPIAPGHESTQPAAKA